MSVPIPLRSDFDAAALRLAAKATKHAAQARRLPALATIYDGGSRSDAERIGGVGLQTVRDWVLAFNAQACPEPAEGARPGWSSARRGNAKGNAPKLDGAQRRALAAMVEGGPIPAVHGVVRWQLRDLAC